MILNNQTYLGKMVQHKDIKISYKDKKKRRLPKEQWIVVDNTHEPIIDQETFDRVQAIQKIKRNWFLIWMNWSTAWQRSPAAARCFRDWMFFQI